LFNDLHAYQIYAITKGIINETYDIAVSVYLDDDAFWIVREFWMLYVDG
jgi:hypothetical protein